MNNKNEPLMFIDTVQELNLKEENYSFKKSISDLSLIENKVLKLVKFYNKNRKILVLIKTKNAKYEGFIFNYKDETIYFKVEENIYHFKLNEIVALKILEV